MKGGVYAASNQAKNAFSNHIDESFFYEDFTNPSGEFWTKLNEADRPDEDQLIFQGRLWQKSGKHKKWIAYHFELYSDKILRIDLSQRKESAKSFERISAAEGGGGGGAAVVTATNQQTITGGIENNNHNSSAMPTANTTTTNVAIGEDLLALVEFIPINSCFLKKIKYSENSYSSYKYGIRLQRGELKNELFTENADTFNRWHDEIKRYCILPKFTKKYKPLAKLKLTSLLPNSFQFFKCFRFSDSSQYCVRNIEKYSLSDSNKQAVLKEIQILRKLDSPFLCRLFEIYEDENNIYLITELFQGKDLKAKLVESPFLEEKTISEIMQRLLSGLQHMHMRQIFHRDIKLENILFRSNQNLTDICLTNFFLADFFDPKNNHKSSYKKCGTPGYMAPEIFKTKQYDQKVDIFSLGVVFYILIFGRPPFETQQVDDTCEIDFTQIDGSMKVTSSAIDLLKRMLAKDPALRPNAFQLMNHTWFINMKNRGDDGRMRNNLYGMPTLSTIQEGSIETIQLSSKQEIFEPRGGPNSNRVYEEYNSGFETLTQKMTVLHSTVFSKFPSKLRHDIATAKILC